jgi:hypothetical protein
MKLNDTLDGLINLPREFNSVGNKSIYDLLKETGYFEIHDKISVESIRNKLAQSPKCIEDWIRYSEDKRSRSGWYFKQEDKQRYVVGFLNGKGNNAHNEYSDRLEACAIFIKQEIDKIRTC